jgi:hypothetical protein
MDLWYALKEWEREMEASPLRLDLSKDLTSVPAAITNYVVSSLNTATYPSSNHSDHVPRYDSPPSTIYCSLASKWSFTGDRQPTQCLSRRGQKYLPRS